MARSKSRRGRRTEPQVYYVLPIRSWHWGYMFSVNNTKWRPDEPFSDYRHLIVQGEMIRPRAIVGHKSELYFVPSPDLLERRSGSEKPSAVGSVGRNRGSDVMHGILSMPQDVLPSLIPMLIAERLRFVVLVGGRLRYGSALIRSYDFRNAIDEEDLPRED